MNCTTVLLHHNRHHATPSETAQLKHLAKRISAAAFLIIAADLIAFRYFDRGEFMRERSENRVNCNVGISEA